MNFCKVKTGRLCWIYQMTSFWRFLMLIAPPFFTRETFSGVPGDEEVGLPTPHQSAPRSSHLRPSFSSQPPHLTILTSRTPLGPFKRCKFPFESLLLLRAPLFGTLSKSTTMSFVGCLLPRHNISKTIRHV